MFDSDCFSENGKARPGKARQDMISDRPGLLDARKEVNFCAAILAYQAESRRAEVV